MLDTQLAFWGGCSFRTICVWGRHEKQSTVKAGFEAFGLQVSWCAHVKCDGE